MMKRHHLCQRQLWWQIIMVRNVFSWISLSRFSSFPLPYPAWWCFFAGIGVWWCGQSMTAFLYPLSRKSNGYFFILLLVMFYNTKDLQEFYKTQALEPMPCSNSLKIFKCVWFSTWSCVMNIKLFYLHLSSCFIYICQVQNYFTKDKKITDNFILI